MGIADASNSLGLMFESGEGVARDLHRALQLYTEAARQGSADGAYNLGCLYEHGRGVKLNLAQAAQHFRVAESLGHAYAAVDLLRLQMLLELPDAPADRPTPSCPSLPRSLQTMDEAASARAEATATTMTTMHAADGGASVTGAGSRDAEGAEAGTAGSRGRGSDFASPTDEPATRERRGVSEVTNQVEEAHVPVRAWTVPAPAVTQ